MKNSKRVILFSVFSISIVFSFLVPLVRAQEWTYNGVDTEPIPEFSVYPSEWYIVDVTGTPPNILYIFEVVKGNMSDPFFLMANGTCVWVNALSLDTTTGMTTLASPNLVLAYWNETTGYFSGSFPVMIPVDNGIVTVPILNNVSSYMGLMLTSSGTSFENQQIYPSIYSFSFWNTSNNAYLNLNFTSDGILTKFETHLVPSIAMNMTLFSQPAQLSPVFTFSTDDDILAVNSTDLTLVVDITDADNNNDQVIDTDYQYRIYNGATWTAWAAIPATIPYDLGNVTTGNYDITMEVKNMYGVSSDQIQIQYTAPSDDGDGDGIPEIPGYSIVLTSIALLLGISFLIHKNRKKM